MIGNCEGATDFLFPMVADIYYPAMSQGSYGEITKTWSFDRNMVCNATGAGGAGKEDIRPETFAQFENKLIARCKTDPRISSSGKRQATTNILVTNIRNCKNEIIYKEMTGPRANRGTVYEIATIEPFTNPFGKIEYYKLVLRKTERQELPSDES